MSPKKEAGHAVAILAVVVAVLAIPGVFHGVNGTGGVGGPRPRPADYNEGVQVARACVPSS